MVILAELILIILWLRTVIGCILGVVAYCRPLPTALPVQLTDLSVSIIVPAYNEAGIIEGTLEALKGLEPPAREIILVDDGSLDATAEIARRCLSGTASALVISLPANAGKAAALNQGIGAAKGELIVTVDADTLLAPDALQAALTALAGRAASAVAFDIDVTNRTTLLGQLQRQEYVSSLLFERAGQDVIGAISILPGAATLFRKAVVDDVPFSGRTRTEDADLTLQLSRKGHRLALASKASAFTLAPATWRTLLAQRERWITGHLQCLAIHGRGLRRTSALFRYAVLPNFAFSTAMLVLTSPALLALAFAGRGSLLGLGWFGAGVLTLGLAYLQRGCAWLVNPERRPSVFVFVIEPHVTNAITLVAFLRAIFSLATGRGGPRPASPGHPRVSIARTWRS